MKLGGLTLLGLWLAGCSQSYPSEKVKEAIQEICRREYGIENIQVKIDGSTIGVFLPIKKLFAVDFKEILATGDLKGQSLDSLFQPSPEALDQVEDVLFSISRVLLSTERKVDFYVLQATDVERTGLQLILSGYMNDIRRVRLWDISRDEYRKRILHELRLNRAVVWQRPVRSFFEMLEKNPSVAAAEPFFTGPVSREFFRTHFFFDPEAEGTKTGRWVLGAMRSAPLDSTRVVVFVPLTMEYDPAAVAPGAFLVPSGTSLEYFFIMSFAEEQPRIVRVIPFSYRDENGAIRPLDIPDRFQIDNDIETWESEFPLTEIKLGDFLAEQLTRRTQNLVYADERVRNTFESIHLSFRYQEEKEERPYFSLDLDVKLKTPTTLSPPPSAEHEDVLYLLEILSREFVDVLRSYKFAEYEFLELNLSSDPAVRILGRDSLELFRRNKTDVQGLLRGISPI